MHFLYRAVLVYSYRIDRLFIDTQQQFLEGYGMGGKKLIEESKDLKAFNLFNYAPIRTDGEGKRSGTRESL